jgi:hypothetical protein
LVPAESESEQAHNYTALTRAAPLLVGGYSLTAAAWKVLPALVPVTIPRLAAARADRTIFGFALAVATINGILFGVAPALRLATGPAIRFSGFGSRGAAARRHDRIRSSLIVLQVARSVMLVLIGAQLIGSFERLVNTDPGFQADRVLASVVLYIHKPLVVTTRFWVWWSRHCLPQPVRENLFVAWRRYGEYCGMIKE